MKKIFLVSFLTLVIALPVLAAGLVPCGGEPVCCETGCTTSNCGNSGQPSCCTPGCIYSSSPNCEPKCQICHFFVMFENIINFFVFTLVPPVAVLMAAVAGILFILGSGFDPGLIYKARSVFRSLMIGLLIIYGSWILVNTFFVFIGAATLQGTWFIINCPAP